LDLIFHEEKHNQLAAKSLESEGKSETMTYQEERGEKLVSETPFPERQSTDPSKNKRGVVMKRGKQERKMLLSEIHPHNFWEEDRSEGKFPGKTERQRVKK